MKKIILIAAAIVFAACVLAQDRPSFGVKGGLNISSESSNEGSTGSRIGLHAGIFIEIGIVRMIAIQPELLFSMQGGESEGVADRFNYINLPLMVKFYIGQARRFSIDAGPQFGYMISGKYVSDGNTVNIYDRDRLKKFDASLGFGVSYKLVGGFELGLRFVAGMTKIYEGLENRNSIFQIGAGYRF